MNAKVKKALLSDIVRRAVDYAKNCPLTNPAYFVRETLKQAEEFRGVPEGATVYTVAAVSTFYRRFPHLR